MGPIAILKNILFSVYGKESKKHLKLVFQIKAIFLELYEIIPQHIRIDYLVHMCASLLFSSDHLSTCPTQDQGGITKIPLLETQLLCMKWCISFMYVYFDQIILSQGFLSCPVPVTQMFFLSLIFCSCDSQFFCRNFCP